MSGKFINKMMGIIGIEDEYDDEFLEDEDVASDEKEEINEEEEKLQTPNMKKRGNKVVAIHNNTSNTKVTLIKLESYDEAAGIVDDVKNRKIVIFNTNGLDNKIAQKILDFIGGASYALEGELSEIERGVYIIAPAEVEVTNELKNEFSSKSLFWGK